MNRSALYAAALIAAGAIAWAPREAYAAESTTNDAPEGYSLNPTRPSPRMVTREYQTPNESFVSSGAFLFGTTYAASAIVAATSDRPEDRRLFIPVAGPWLDLRHRERCPD